MCLLSAELLPVHHGIPTTLLWDPQVRPNVIFLVVILANNLRLIVQWTKRNPTPWNDIKADEGVKLVQINHKFDKAWVLLFISSLYCTDLLPLPDGSGKLCDPFNLRASSFYSDPFIIPFIVVYHPS